MISLPITMADDIDAMLQGEETPSAPQAGTDQQDDSIKRIEQQTDEEVEFNKLSGSTQDRIKQLIRDKNEALERASFQAPVPPAPNTIAPDQKQAIETLANFGIATDDKVDKKVSEGINQVRWELRNANLQQKYTGANGEPKYDPTEVEDYMRTHPQFQYYDPEDVFKYKMFPDEFANVGTQTQKPRSQSLKPTKTQQEPVAGDIQWLMDRIDPTKHADADEYYETHKDEINQAIKNHTLQFKDVNFGGQ